MQQEPQRFFEFRGLSYYAAYIPLDENGLKAELGLEI